MIRRRLLALAALLLTAAAGAGGAALAGYRYGRTSGATDELVLAQPVYAKVERRVVTSSLRVEASVETSWTVEVALAGGSFEARVATRPLPRVGDRLEVGSVIAEIDDRPTILMPGAVGLYRELTEGDRGPDVERLQQALNDLGYPIEVDGIFGAETAEALGDLYTDRGYDAPTAAPHGGEGSSGGPPGEGAVPATGSTVAARPDELFFSAVDPLYVVESAGGDPGAGLEPRLRVMGPDLAVRTVALSAHDADALLSAATVHVARLAGGSGRLRLAGLERLVADDGVHLVARLERRPDGPAVGETVIVEGELFSSGDPVLVVPSVAVVPAGETGAAVRVLREGIVSTLAVGVGPTIDGFTVIEHANGLAVGDRVLVDP